MEKTISSVSDIVEYEGNFKEKIDPDYEETITGIKTLKDKVGSYESEHQNDLDKLTELLDSFNKLVKSYLSQPKSSVKSYESGDVARLDAANLFGTAMISVAEGLEANKDSIAKAMERDNVRFEELKAEAADERRNEGIKDGINAFLVGAGGIAAIVLTAGAATPLVATLGTVSGLGTYYYGASNLVESAQDIKYGIEGDIDTLAINPIRDTVFLGNQENYDMFGKVSMITSGFTGGGVASTRAISSLTARGMSTGNAMAQVGFKTVSTGIGAYSGSKVLGKTSYYVAKDIFGLSESDASVYEHAGKILGGTIGGAIGYKTSDFTLNKLRNVNFGSVAHASSPSNSLEHNIEGSTKVIAKDGKVTITGEGEITKTIDNRPYLDSKSRPSFRKGIVEMVWENAKEADGLVRDPLTREVIDWEPGKPRKGIWDMGHIPDQKYSNVHKDYLNEKLTPKEFRDWYNTPEFYRPETVNTNRSHKLENGGK